MSWFNENWKRRQPFAVDNTGGAGTIDVELVIPPEWDDFWENVQVDGDDVRVCLADGSVVASYKLAAWTHATRSGTIHVDNVVPGDADCIPLLWLYWDNAAAPSGAATFTVAAPKPSLLSLAGPKGNVIRAKQERPDVAKPSSTVTKQTTETIHVWVDMSGQLERRSKAHNGTPLLDEIRWVKLQVLLSGVDQTAMYNESRIRFVHPGWVLIEISGGTTATDYTISLTVDTTEGQRLNPRALLKVRDVSE
jgi:hypothetical protein